MNTSNCKRLYLDVGGTFIKCSDGRVIPTASGGSRDAVAAALRKAVGTADAPEGIGVAIPGPFDYREGVFRMKHKFASVYGESFRELAGIPEGIPLRFIHDVVALLKGAIVRLGLRENTALVTIGTGLGFACSRGTDALVNANGSPEKSLYDRPFRDGAAEDYVSARGIQRRYAAKSGRKADSVLDIARKACAGDLYAMETFSETGEILGEILPALLEETDCGTLLFGGQVSKSFHLMERPIRNALDGIRIEQVPEGAVFDGIATLF